MRVFDLPTEVQWEAAARGTRGWIYPYGDEFDVTQGNTFESHIRRSTPIGIYGGTPENIFDLSGNVYDWTLSLYDQEQFPYPYKANEGSKIISSSNLQEEVRAQFFKSPSPSGEGFRGLRLKVSPFFL